LILEDEEGGSNTGGDDAQGEELAQKEKKSVRKGDPAALGRKGRRVQLLVERRKRTSVKEFLREGKRERKMSEQLPKIGCKKRR